MEDGPDRAIIETAENPLRLNIRVPDGTFKYFEVRSPSAEAHLHMVDRLVFSTNALRRGADPLATTVEVLRDLVDFFQNDPATLLAGAHNPVVVILDAVNDTKEGANPLLLKKRKKRKKSELEKNSTASERYSARHRQTSRLIDVIKSPLQLNIQSPNGTFKYIKVGIPSVESYKVMVRRVVILENAMRKGADTLEISAEALRNTVEYFELDLATKVSDALQSLSIIIDAINDTLAGARLSMFTNRPTGEGGRPTRLEMYRSWAFLAIALNVLLEKTPMSEEDATTFMLRELAQEGFYDARTRVPFTAERLIQMRKKARDGTGPTDFFDFYTQLKKLYDKNTFFAAAPTTDPEALARMIIMAAAKHSPGFTR